MIELPPRDESDTESSDDEEFLISIEKLKKITNIITAEKLREVTSSVTQQGKNVVKERVDAGADVIRLGVDNLKNELRKKTVKTLRDAYTAEAGRSLHKYCYIVMDLNLIFTSLCVGRFPQFFWFLYTVKLCLLLPARLFLYRFKRQHYFLIDFCYFANAFLFAFIFLGPNQEWLWKICFVFHGTLGISIPICSNAIVPHSIDKMTSAELHIAPLTAIYCIRWFSSSKWVSADPMILRYMPEYVQRVSFFSTNFESVSGFENQAIFWKETFPFIFLVYSLWAIPYYTKIFWLSKKPKSTTLYTFFVKKFEQTLPRALASRPRFSFLTFHFITFVCGSYIAALSYHNYLLHSGFLIAMVVVLCKNGANFYVFQFAKDYERQLMFIEGSAQSLESDAEFLRFARFGHRFSKSDSFNNKEE